MAVGILASSIDFSKGEFGNTFYYSHLFAGRGQLSLPWFLACTLVPAQVGIHQAELVITWCSQQQLPEDGAGARPRAGSEGPVPRLLDC